MINPFSFLLSAIMLNVINQKNCAVILFSKFSFTDVKKLVIQLNLRNEHLEIKDDWYFKSLIE